MRHSLAHILAGAVQQLYPDAKFGIGPTVDDGFYYDIDFGDDSVGIDDLKKIEAEMQKIIKADYPFEQEELSMDDAIEWAIQHGQDYKESLLKDLAERGSTAVSDIDTDTIEAGADSASFYRSGEFVDLCRGPHVESTGQVGAYKLHKVAGAYWRGDENNPQMTRIYGLGFDTQEELDAYLLNLEKAKENDHRKLGTELDLYFISENVGAGLPLLMPRGEMVKNLLMRYMRQVEEERCYKYVSTPVLTQEKLYQRSGHADHYLENMYATQPDEEGNKFYIKPMNCPHHHMIYEKLVESYRDLPLRLAEHAGLYRYELSGTLSGLIRMRGPITQNDSHHYVTEDQVEEEFTDVLNLFHEVYETTGVEDYWFRLSLPDFKSEKYAGEKGQWESAAELIKRCLKATNSKFVEEEDEAAFYGPKLDVQIKNVLGNEDSIATVQLDIVVPERMDLTYADENDEKKHPVVIHKSIMGAFERFMAFLIEQTGGHLPFWLAPEQIRILTINDQVFDYVDKITAELDQAPLMQPLKYNEIRYTLDGRNESLGKKIREAEVAKIPMMFIVGPKDVEAGEVSVRTRDGEEKIKLGDLKEYIGS